MITTSKGKKYLVQAIVYKHILDTPALEECTQTSVTSSNGGCCFCGKLHGYRREKLKRNTMVGHRRFLDENHLLRTYGMSGICCPDEYYLRAKTFAVLSPSGNA